MSRWIQNLISYSKNKTIDKCPYCGSSNVEVTEHEGIRKSVTFLCNDCKKTDHFDGNIIN